MMCLCRYEVPAFNKPKFNIPEFHLPWLEVWVLSLLELKVALAFLMITFITLMLGSVEGVGVYGGEV